MSDDLTLRMTTDASLTSILEERPFFVEDTVTLVLGADETIPDAFAGPRPALRRGNDRALARMGARARHPVRVAGRRHPRRDHAEAQRVRRHRRDRRRDDDVAAGGADSARNWDYASAGCATAISS